MAGNKFATMLHKNTHKITMILVYAVLEWILIILLLLNSLFTYLITKFADYFGLKRPCLWCSRVDHVLEPGNNTNSYRDLVCETHAGEISTLTYCSSHQRLAETQNMCAECLASRPQHNDESIGMARRIAYISLVSTHKLQNDDDQALRCSCCSESLKNKLYPPYLLFKSSWGALDYTQRGGLITEAMGDDNNRVQFKEKKKPNSQASLDENDNEIERNHGEECHNDKEAVDEFHVISDIDSFGLTEVAEENYSRSESNLQYEEKEAYEGEELGKASVHYSRDDDNIIQFCSAEDDLLEIINLGSERNIEFCFNRVIPIELIDSSTTANQVSCNVDEGVLRTKVDEIETFDSSLLLSETQANVLVDAQLIGTDDNGKKTRYEEFERSETYIGEVEDSSVQNVEEEMQDLVGEACEQVIANQVDQILSTNGNEVEAKSMNEPARTEEANESNLSVAEVEAADHAANQPQAQELALPCQQEDQSSMNTPDAEIINPSEDIGQNDLDQKHAETDTILENMSLVCKNQEGINLNLSIRSEPNEADEEKFPDTPTYAENFHYLHKKLLLLEKRESGTEESLDGSVVSEMESSDPVLTIERLRSALKTERKALSALYAELEEERSASAIAANQTMAMITRLQEEKAAMQMEALQYQRMMDEQSEYDQEALQLLNELMVKREKEKQELEKELEIYHKKVLDYEAKEKMRMMRRSTDGSVRSRKSSASCSNSEDTDELSIDLNREARDEDSSLSGRQESTSDNTPADEVVNLEEMALDCVKHMTALDESLTEFEEERLSILDQLKVLEEKLISVGDDEFIEDLKSINQPSNYAVNEFDKNHDFSSPTENGDSNDFSKDGLYPEKKTMASMAKSLLPLLEATGNETEGLIYEEQAEFDSVEIQNSSVSTFDLDNKRLAIVEEVDHVYERLQALEADREFLKHCVSSVKKGDKGMDLLHEILQHLRDLRAVELQVSNMDDDAQIL
ncbi:myosin-binding protein 2-like isoform X2 [Pistacia vera]|uniref:myosin-binding protein 2-like isoform X2 n=1 Tax=Pistacia vera TaxID=55513 RepID=UPI001262CD9C|nr:myosin-binding protein 2-like isoform X2 [Pistacia vera]XP_031257891.1 myosin-binding protein 2-like isoform X2 [Pistacia vera]